MADDIVLTKKGKAELIHRYRDKSEIDVIIDDDLF